VAPATTVIIPTYNWSAALRCSIASVLAQTDPDFELLVIGDACTDDSADVARSFADPRVQWHNLPARVASQSGPNNHGLSLATGRYIAYLGHDDVWHPDHLRSLISCVEETGSDLVCSMALLYGPPGSGIRAVTGALVDGRDRAVDFYPPTSLLHRRALTERMGAWKLPADCAVPVDAEFLERARQHETRISSSGRLTAFKFNASWRRDSYRRRDIAEQEQLLARLRSDPSGTVASELEDVVRATCEKRLIQIRMPDPATPPPGGYHRANLRSRGLEDGAATPLTGRHRFSLDAQASALDWHGVEAHPEWGTFRWSGPSPVSVIVLPVLASGGTAFTMQALNWFHADVASEVTVSVNDRPVPYTIAGDGDPVLRLHGVIESGTAADGPLRIRLENRVMRCPHFVHGNADERWLGVCINWVELAPAG
jgi:hypothetical protein